MFNIKFNAKDITHIAIFAALIGVLGQLSISVGVGVPITGQTLAIYLASVILGPVKGVLSVVLLLLLAVLGFPVLSGGSGGISILYGASSGYIYGWIIASFVIGLIAHAGQNFKLYKNIIALLAGSVIIHILGIAGFMLVLGLSFGEAAAFDALYIPGDIIKIVITCAACHILYKVYRKAYPAYLYK